MKKLSEKVAEAIRRLILVVAAGWALFWIVGGLLAGEVEDALPLLAFSLLYFPLSWVLRAFAEEHPGRAEDETEPSSSEPAPFFGKALLILIIGVFVAALIFAAG